MVSSTRTSKTSTQSTSTAKTSRGTSVNRVILVGRIVATPELRKTGKGIHVTTVRVATNDREQAVFHDVVLWRQHADFAVTYMAKGPDSAWNRSATTSTVRRLVPLAPSQVRAWSRPSM